MSPLTAIDGLLDEIKRKERLARRRAVIYTMAPIMVSVVLIVWTSRKIMQANVEVQNAQQKVVALQRQVDLANQQLQEASNKLVGIATVTKDIEALVESKKSYLRTIDEARFLIDLRMRFDALNSDLLTLSASVPAMQKITDNRKWVAVVQSSKDLHALKLAAQPWIESYGRSNIGIYRSTNGIYALVVLGDGKFTQAYRLTVSLIQSGRAANAYFADASEWGPSLISE